MRRGLTLVELLVVMACLAILAGLLLLVISSVKANAYQTVCVNNLKQIGLAITLYRDDWDVYVPGHVGFQPWMTVNETDSLLDAYLANDTVRHCPGRDTDVGRYCINMWQGMTENSPQGRPEASVPNPSKTLIVWEHRIAHWGCSTGQGGGNAIDPDPDAGINHWDSSHHGGFNALWCDGHVKRMRYAQLRRRFFTIEED